LTSNEGGHGWTGSRQDWISLADRLVTGALNTVRPATAVTQVEAPPSAHGHAADGLEGFARSFLMLSFRMAGTGGGAPHGTVDRVREIVSIGTTSPDPSLRWLQPSDYGHAVVEASSIALSFWLSKPWIWDCMDAESQTSVVKWLRCAASSKTSQNNWILFRAVIAAFLIDVGRGDEELEHFLSTSLGQIEDWVTESGWYSDGPTNAFDYYNSWAFHFYPAIIAYLLKNDELINKYSLRLSSFLQSFIKFFATDGSHIYFGRSLTYRFGVTTALSVGALLKCLPFPELEAREIASSNVRYFLDGGAIEPNDTLARGWFSDTPSLVQNYSGPLASYWAAKAFVNLLIPQDAPYWAEPSTGSIHKNSRNDHLMIEGANLLVTSAHYGKIVKLANHGSYNRSTVDDQAVVDDKFYSRVAYSNVTAPVDARQARDAGFFFTTFGGPSGRGRVQPLQAGTNWASSWSHHRVKRSLALPGKLGKKIGRRLPLLADSRELTSARVQTMTLVLGSWSVEILRVENIPKTFRCANLGGWAIPASITCDRSSIAENEEVVVSASGLSSRLVPLLGFAESTIVATQDPSPFSVQTSFPVLSTRRLIANSSLTLAAAMMLSSSDSEVEGTDPPSAFCPSAHHIQIKWSDTITDVVNLKTMTVDPRS
jgi:hypothetical protein